MKYKGIELKEITSLQVFDPPKELLVWEDSTDSNEPHVDTVCAVVRTVIGTTQVIGDFGLRWKHCAEIPKETKPRRATNRELAKWIAQGNGEWRLYGTAQIGANTNYEYNTYEEKQNVTDGVLVRKWDDTEWQEPTVDYLGIE